MSANGNPTAEVVVALDELAPQGAGGVFDESQAQGFEVGEAALNRGLSIATSIGGHGSWSAPSRATQNRQRQQSLMLESFEQQAALVVFHPAIGPLPIQPLTDRARDFGDPQSGIELVPGFGYLLIGREATQISNKHSLTRTPYPSGEQ